MENKKIWVSQKAIITDKEGKILAIRRSKTAPSRPLNWDLPGGDLSFGEEADKGMRREIKEETGLEAEDLKVVDAISGLNDAGEFWVTICYTAKPKTKEITLSYEHDDFRWVTPSEFQELQVSSRNKEFVKRFNKVKVI